MINNKKLRTLLLVVCYFNQGCSQNTNKNTQEKSQIEINNSMLSQVEKEINSFTSRPYYSVEFDNANSGCQFEILVNDIPVFRKIGINGGVTSAAPINSCILKSGKQKLTIKLYPNIGKENIIASNKDKSPLNLSVSYRKDAWNNSVLDEVVIFKLPPIILPDNGLPYFEEEVEFEAIVPYEFDGWANSKDLTKVVDIEQKVLNKYKEIQKLLIDKNYALFAKMKTQKDLEMNISFYLKPNEIVAGENFDKEAFTEKNAEVQSLENSKIVFYGKGKLVTLENINDKASALRTILKHNKNGKETEEVIRFPVLLHMPQNSNELEIIR